MKKIKNQERFIRISGASLIVIGLLMMALPAIFVTGPPELWISVFILGTVSVFVGVFLLVAAPSLAWNRRTRVPYRSVVERWLDQLDKKSKVLAHPEIDTYSFEYVVVTSTGVFVIRTATNFGRLWVNEGQLMLNGRGYSGQQLGRVWQDARWLKNWLKRHGIDQEVRPLLVFTDAYTDILKFQESTILPLRWLQVYISRGDPVMESAEWKKIASELESWTIKANRM